MNINDMVKHLLSLTLLLTYVTKKSSGNNNDNIVQILLNKGGEVNLCTTTRVVPLFVACQKISPLFIVHMIQRIS